MLLELHIRNLLILREARLEPGEGLTVISGETGAGKSLLLDALDLLLGGRGSGKWVGPSADEATVSGVFQVDAGRAAAIAEATGITLEDQQLVLRRRLASSGRSQAWINEQPVGVTTLRRVGVELVDIRVQHEHLRLSKVERQLELIDRYGNHRELAEAYAGSHRAVLDRQAELMRLQEGDRDSLRELDYLRFLLREIEELDPRSGELGELEQRQSLLAGAQEWRALAEETTARLADDDESVSAVLSRLGQRLVEAPDEALAGAGAACLQALEAVRDAAMAAAGAADRLEADPGELARIDQRIAAYDDLLRKHGGTEAALLVAREETAQRVAELENLDQRRLEIAAELEAARRQREDLGSQLAAARAKAFKRLGKAVQAELAELGMPKARLLLHESPAREPGPLGLRHQEIHVQTNPGLPAGPLGEIASGGEAARLTLALAVPLADADDTPVLVFDEVDAGVGGRLGTVMGSKLAVLARGRSVLAVTHTPQLAAAATTNYLVSKEQGKASTAVTIRRLVGEELLSELAEMLGGGTAARQQAAAMLGEVRPRP